MSRFDIPEEYWDAPPEPYEGAFFDAFMNAVNEATPSPKREAEGVAHPTEDVSDRVSEDEEETT